MCRTCKTFRWYAIGRTNCSYTTVRTNGTRRTGRTKWTHSIGRNNRTQGTVRTKVNFKLKLMELI